MAEKKTSSKKDEKQDINVLMKTAGFDPRMYIRETEYENSGKKEMYLDVKYRLEWYLTYCQEHNISSRIVEENIIVHESLGLIEAHCSIYHDDVLVSRGGASRTYRERDFDMLDKIIQTANTFAKGRALANLGFTLTSTDDGDPIPCDSGICATPWGNITTNPDNPMDSEFVRDSVPAPAQNPGPMGAAPSAKAASRTMTWEEARDYVIPINSRFKGQTLGTVLACDRSTVEWYASSRFAVTWSANQYPDLVQAAKIVLNGPPKQ